MAPSSGHRRVSYTMSDSMSCIRMSDLLKELLPELDLALQQRGLVGVLQWSRGLAATEMSMGHREDRYFDGLQIAV